MPDKIEWAAPEYTYYKKDKSWFFLAGIIFGILMIWSLWTRNILFAIFIALSYFLIVVFALKKPETTFIAINHKGIRINTDFHEFDTLKSFWIFYEPPEIGEISLKSKRKTASYIKIPLGEQNPVEIRELLIKYLPERKQSESLIDNLFRSIGF
jgi:hypothetical protein